MNAKAIQEFMLRLFERHDVELEPDEDWLVTDGDFPAVRACWREGAPGAPGRLDVDVVLDEERHVEESFAGHGGGSVGCRDALAAFEQSAFHVMLAACWYVTDDRRMQLAHWKIGAHQWDVFIGPFVTRGAPAADVKVPDGVDAALASALREEALTPELHWVRLFRAQAADGTVSVEALLDNAPWPAGDRALNALAWPTAATAYSARCFAMLDVRDY